MCHGKLLRCELLIVGSLNEHKIVARGNLWFATHVDLITVHITYKLD